MRATAHLAHGGAMTTNTITDTAQAHRAAVGRLGMVIDMRSLLFGLTTAFLYGILQRVWPEGPRGTVS